MISNCPCRLGLLWLFSNTESDMDFPNWAVQHFLISPYNIMAKWTEQIWLPLSLSLFFTIIKKSKQNSCPVLKKSIWKILSLSYPNEDCSFFVCFFLSERKKHLWLKLFDIIKYVILETYVYLYCFFASFSLSSLQWLSSNLGQAYFGNLQAQFRSFTGKLLSSGKS